MMPRAAARFFATLGSYPGRVLSISGGIPQTPSGGGCIAPPMSPCPKVRTSMKAWWSYTERHRPPQLGVVKRRRGAIDQQGARQVGREHRADRLRRLARKIPQQRDRHPEDLIERTGDKSQDARRKARDDRPLDAVEIGPARLPVIGVSRHPDVFVRLEFDEFEWAGADRMLAHVARRDVTRIDRRPARGQQRQERRLWAVQTEGDLIVAVDTDLVEVAVPRLARIEA